MAVVRVPYFMALVERVFQLGKNYYSSNAWPIIVGAGDFLGSLLRFGLTVHLALRDIRLRYRRTIFGPIWTVFNASVFVGAVGIVFGLLWGIDPRVYIPFFAVGYFVWMVIIQQFTEAGEAFSAADTIIRSMKVPQGVHVQRVLVRNAIVLSHLIPVLAFFLLIFQAPPALYAIWAIPLGFVLLFGLIYWVSLILAVLCTRYRDIKQIVGLITQVAFLATPIIWPASNLVNASGEIREIPYAILVTWNPFYHMVEIIRAPVLADAVPYFSMVYLLAANFIVGMIALDLHGRKKSHVAVWL